MSLTFYKLVPFWYQQRQCQTVGIREWHVANADVKHWARYPWCDIIPEARRCEERWAGLS